MIELLNVAIYVSFGAFNRLIPIEFSFKGSLLHFGRSGLIKMAIFISTDFKREKKNNNNNTGCKLVHENEVGRISYKSH